MFKKLLIIAWVGLVGLTAACKGPQGDVGPQGEKGDTGATGATGPAGAAGGGGGGGALIFGLGADTTDADGYFSLGIPNLTAEEEEAWDSAVIMVYLKSGGAYWPLPGIVSFGNTAGSSEFTFYHGIENKTFFLDVFQINWSGRASAADKPPVRIVQDFRFIVIPGSKQSRMSNVNLKNYEETIAALGLTDQDVKNVQTIRRDKK